MSFLKRAVSNTTSVLLLASVVACSSNKNVSDDEFVLEEDISSEQITFDGESSGNDLTLNELEASLSKDAGIEAPSSEADNITVDVFETSKDGLYLKTANTPAPVADTPQAGTKRPYQGAQATQVMQSPFDKNGFVMNAFYFVQSDREDYASLSKLIYGRPDRAQLLKDWNENKKVSAGELFYYNSFFRPADRQQMLSLYDDFGFEWASYTVKLGDSLSSLSAQLYGHTKNWNNIAAYNPELRSPDSLEIGQKIRLPKLQIDTNSKREAFKLRAKQEEEARQEEEMAKQQAEQAAMNSQNSQPADSSEMTNQNMNEEMNSQAEQDSALGEDVKELATIDDLLDEKPKSSRADQERLMYVGGALIVLSLLLLIIRRRRRKASE